MPPAELGPHGIPEQLQHLDPLDRVVAARAPEIAIDQGPKLGVLEIVGVGVQIDQTTRDGLLDDLLHPGIGRGRQRPVGHAVGRIGLVGTAHPRLCRFAHRVAERPEGVAPGQDLPDLHPRAGGAAIADRLRGLQQETRQKVEFYGEARAPVHAKARDESRQREVAVGLVEIAIEEDVLPGHEHLVEHQDRVVLVEPRGERVVEGAPHHRCVELVRRPTDELYAGAVHREHRKQRHRRVAQRRRPVVADEVEVGEGGSRGDDLCAAHDQAGVGLLFDVDIHVPHIVGHRGFVDRRIHEGVVEKEAALLREAVPALGVLVVGLVELGVGAERAGQARFVVGGAPHPAVGDPRPGRDRLSRLNDLFGGARHFVEGMGEAAVARVGGRGEHLPPLGVVKRVIHPRDHPSRVAERGVVHHVFDPLAAEPDLAVVREAREVLSAGIGADVVAHPRAPARGRFSVYRPGG